MAEGKARGNAVVSTEIYVEGGGWGKAADVACRRSFSTFIQRIVPGSQRMPKIVACGPRHEALRAFEHALKRGTVAPVLLVDSETTVGQQANPWQHLASTPGMRRPVRTTDEQAQLMTVTVETWIASDPGALRTFYGEGFASNALPSGDDLESISKKAMLRALQNASRRTRKGSYAKSHAFDLLPLVDPANVERRCTRWGARFVEFARARFGAAAPSLPRARRPKRGKRK